MGDADTDADADNDSRPLPSGARSTGHFGEVVQWQYEAHGGSIPPARRMDDGRLGYVDRLTGTSTLAMENGALMRVRPPPSPPDVSTLADYSSDQRRTNAATRAHPHVITCARCSPMTRWVRVYVQETVDSPGMKDTLELRRCGHERGDGVLFDLCHVHRLTPSDESGAQKVG